MAQELGPSRIPNSIASSKNVANSTTTAVHIGFLGLSTLNSVHPTSANRYILLVCRNGRQRAPTAVGSPTLVRRRTKVTTSSQQISLRHTINKETATRAASTAELASAESLERIQSCACECITTEETASRAGRRTSTKPRTHQILTKVSSVSQKLT